MLGLAHRSRRAGGQHARRIRTTGRGGPRIGSTRRKGREAGTAAARPRGGHWVPTGGKALPPRGRPLFALPREPDTTHPRPKGCGD